jgi:hypothetical protein
VTTETKRAVVTIQSLGAGDLKAAVDDLERLLRTWFGADVAHVTLNAVNPVVDLPV